MSRVLINYYKDILVELNRECRVNEASSEFNGAVKCGEEATH